MSTERAGEEEGLPPVTHTQEKATSLDDFASSLDPTGEHHEITDEMLNEHHRAHSGSVYPLLNLPVPPCDLDTYTLTHLYAEGGTARVYRAFEAHSKQPVAIKILRRRFHHDPLLAPLFLRHGVALSQLNIPHFASVISVGSAQWGPWWAMDWVEGETVRSLIKSGKHWEKKRLLTLMIQLCEALEGLHALNITHGDIKSDNVLYSSRKHPSPSEHFTLIDPALPLTSLVSTNSQEDVEDTLDAETSLFNPAFGHPAYLAPERIIGQAPSAQSDLYSLGVLFFELTTHRLPFTSSLPALIDEVLHQQAPMASQIQKPWPYPPALDALICNLLSKHPRDRCSSVSEVKKQLSRMLGVIQDELQYSTTEELSSDHIRMLRQTISVGSDGINIEASSRQSPSRSTHQSARKVSTPPPSSTSVSLSWGAIWGAIGAFIVIAVYHWLLG